MPITYNQATNLITVTGSFYQGIVEDPAVYGPNSTTDFHVNGDLRTAGLDGRQIWLHSYANTEGYTKTIGHADWFRIFLGGDNPLPTIPNFNDPWIASYNMEDIYQASVAGAWVDAGGLPVVEKVGTNAYFLRAGIFVDGTGTTLSFLALTDVSIEFDTAAGKALYVDGANGRIQFGTLYDGLAKNGCNLKIRLLPGSAGARNGAKFYMYDTHMNFADELGLYGNAEVIARDCSFFGFIPTIGPLIRMWTPGTWTNCKFSDSAGDQWRKLSINIREPQVFDNNLFDHKFEMIIECVFSGGATEMFINNLVDGGGQTAYGTVKWGGGPYKIHLISPKGVDLTPWTVTNNNTTTRIDLYLEHHYDITVSDANGPLQNALVTMSDNQYIIAFEQLTDVNGKIPTQAVATQSKDWTNVLTSYSPHHLFVYAFGYEPVAYTKNFTGPSFDAPTLRKDPYQDPVTYTPTLLATINSQILAAGAGLSTGAYLDPAGNTYSFQVDCGGKSLTDIYNWLYYNMSQLNPDVVFKTLRTRISQPLKTSDGVNFYGGQGVWFVNYTGKLVNTTADDGTVYAPLQYVMFTINNLQPGSEIRIYDAVNGTELGGIEEVLTNTWTYQYNFTGTPQDVRVVIFHKNYNPVTFTATLDGNDNTIPVNQVIDRVFYNPPTPNLKTNYFPTGKNLAKTITLSQIIAGSTYQGQPYDGADITGITIVTPPTNGTFVDNGNGTFTYTPNNNYLGTDFVEYLPHYSTQYPGAVLPARIDFETLPFYGPKYDNVIIVGDSIYVRLYSAGSTFDRRYKELFGRSINVYNESISGTTTTYWTTNIGPVLDKYAHLDPAKTIVLLGLGTNDMSLGITPRTNTAAANANNRLAMHQNYNTIVNEINIRGMTPVITEIPCMPLNNVAHQYWLYDVATESFVAEEFGPYYWNEDTDGIHVIAQQHCPNWVTAGGRPLDQFYYHTRHNLLHLKGFEDYVHPNPWGRIEMQQALMNSVFILNEYGKKVNDGPAITLNQIGNGYARRVLVNLTDAVNTAPNRIGLQACIPNNIDFTAAGGVTNVPLNYGDGTASPYTLTINNNGGVLVPCNPLSTSAEELFPWQYLSYGVEVTGASTVTFTIGGLTPNNIYFFRGIGSFAGANRRGTIVYPELNRTTTCDASQIYHRSGSLSSNRSAYYAIHFIPQGTTATFTLQVTDTYSLGAYLNAFEFWHLAA